MQLILPISNGHFEKLDPISFSSWIPLPRHATAEPSVGRGSVYETFSQLGGLEQGSKLAEWIYNDPSASANTFDSGRAPLLQNETVLLLLHARDVEGAGQSRLHQVGRKEL